MGTPVYFDNAATTQPKPPAVAKAMAAGLRMGNPGRGGHPLSRMAGEAVFHARETAAAFFDCPTDQVVFTSNCTHALNLAIHGLLRAGDHVVISGMEHNSVARPIATLAAAGMIRYTVAPVSHDDSKTLAAFQQALQPNTRAVVCMMMSNVTGQILPYREIAALCRARNIVMIVDGAQGCGLLPVHLRADGIQLLCTAGHKGLYGAMGTGLLLSDGSISLRPLLQGGTGSRSHDLMQPMFFPDAMEAGTVNVPGICGLDAGMKWVQQQGMESLYAHECALCQRLIAGLRQIPDAVVYRHPAAHYGPVVSFLLGREAPIETAARLAQQGYCVRAGLHCAPLCHQQLGTAEAGTVRFSPSYANTPQQVDGFLRALQTKP